MDLGEPAGGVMEGCWVLVNFLFVEVWCFQGESRLVFGESMVV